MKFFLPAAIALAALATNASASVNDEDCFLHCSKVMLEGHNKNNCKQDCIKSECDDFDDDFDRCKDRCKTVSIVRNDSLLTFVCN
ncbi:hypothetical protein THAOC_24072 [Thalassiosira oceanica]|uniref:Uncharacterized protein n=1 Tax=Thalassiosira oceanica TaxID=159749 RepID=K0RUL5_THAOC|nr:hypothetical protein THAOC_24072 [Thalassiosira oceanica]|eukprot:EJK56104.1 hypothetical protein THAOC_24072 [Thalassiosira oceanica]